MKKNFPSSRFLCPVMLAAFLGFILPGHAVTVLFDFSVQAGAAAPGNDPLGRTWNSVAPANTTTVTSVNTVRDTTGATVTGFTLAAARLDTVGIAQNAGAGTNASYPIQATDDFFANPTTTPYVITLAGLDPGMVYSFTMFSSRTTGATDRHTSFFATGANSGSILNINSANNTSVSTISTPITPDGTNSIVFSFAKANASDNFGYLNVLEIAISPVPEPSTFTLFGLAGGFLCLVAGRRLRLRA
jgi:hypothetical protein